mmetsp:Transcript_24286/g.56947  ORF Transcript_24286/g.56947 Transcript_24286/m.56947 type:complete len:271 (+) Transcript_24286:769-1581(+)
MGQSAAIGVPALHHPGDLCIWCSVAQILHQGRPSAGNVHLADVVGRSPHGTVGRRRSDLPVPAEGLQSRDARADGGGRGRRPPVHAGTRRRGPGLSDVRPQAADEGEHCRSGHRRGRVGLRGIAWHRRHGPSVGHRQPDHSSVFAVEEHYQPPCHVDCSNPRCGYIVGGIHGGHYRSDWCQLRRLHFGRRWDQGCRRERTRHWCRGARIGHCSLCQREGCLPVRSDQHGLDRGLDHGIGVASGYQEGGAQPRSGSLIRGGVVVDMKFLLE